MCAINYKKIILVLSVGIPLISCALIPVDHTATAKLPDNLEISITLTPIISLQSDWERQLTIRHRNEIVSKELFSDTGWWSGTSLYLHSSGSLLLYEGKDSCVEFRLNPINFVRLTDETHNCYRLKTINANEVNLNMTKSHQKKLDNNFISSKYFTDLYYIGTFEEPLKNTGRKRIHFYSFEEGSEPDL